MVNFLKSIIYWTFFKDFARRTIFSMNTAKHLKSIFKTVIISFVVISAAIYIYFNRPGKYFVGSCVKPVDGHLIYKIEGISRLKGVYFITRPGEIGRAIDIRSLENNKEFVAVDCS